MIVDKGVDFPPEIDAVLKAYGEDMWLFRDVSPAGTTRALNLYQGDHRGYVPPYFCPASLLQRGNSPLYRWAKKFSVPHTQAAHHSS